MASSNANVGLASASPHVGHGRADDTVCVDDDHLRHGRPAISSLDTCVRPTLFPASTGFVPFLMEQEYAPQDMNTRTFDVSGRPATSIKEARDVFTRTLFTLAARGLICASGLSSDIFNGQYERKWRIRPARIRGVTARNHVEEQCGTERTLDERRRCVPRVFEVLLSWTAEDPQGRRHE